MSFEFEWLGIAEASTQDGRGAVALVGLNQNVVLAKQLPAPGHRVVVVLLEEQAGAAVSSADRGVVALAVSVISPSNKVLLTSRQSMPVGERRYPDIPGSIQLVADLSLKFDEPGTYVIRCEVESPDGTSNIREKNLYVVRVDADDEEPSAGSRWQT